MVHPKHIALNAQIDSFPALPETVSKVLAITNKFQSTAKDLIECPLIIQVADILSLMYCNRGIQKGKAL
jgi:hypothetical protein